MNISWGWVGSGWVEQGGADCDSVDIGRLGQLGRGSDGDFRILLQAPADVRRYFAMSCPGERCIGSLYPGVSHGEERGGETETE